MLAGLGLMGVPHWQHRLHRGRRVDKCEWPGHMSQNVAVLNWGRPKCIDFNSGVIGKESFWMLKGIRYPQH